jgi:hypothetical protein
MSGSLHNRHQLHFGVGVNTFACLMEPEAHCISVFVSPATASCCRRTGGLNWMNNSNFAELGAPPVM